MSTDIIKKELGFCELLAWARKEKVEWAALNTANNPEFIAVSTDEKGMSRIIARSDTLYTTLKKAYNKHQLR